MSNITYELHGVPVKYSKYIINFGENISWESIHQRLKYKNVLPARAGDYIVWNVYDTSSIPQLIDSVKAKYHNLYHGGIIEVLVDNREQVEGDDNHLQKEYWTFNDDTIDEIISIKEDVSFEIIFEDLVKVEDLLYTMDEEKRVHPGLMINGIKCELGKLPVEDPETGESVLLDALLWYGKNPTNPEDKVLKCFSYLPPKPDEYDWEIDRLQIVVKWPYKVSSVQFSLEEAIPIKQMYDHQNKCLNPSPFFPKTAFNAVINENGETLTTIIERLKAEHQSESFKIACWDKYLYYIEYKDVKNYAYAEKYFDKYESPFGACTSVRVGDFYGRNYDWYYDASAQIVTYVPAGGERKYASYGVSCMDGINKDTLDNTIKMGTGGEWLDILPYMIKDGINEKNLVCSMNVVPNDWGTTTETSEAGLHGCLSGIIRRILDNCASVSEAVAYVKNNVYSWYTPNRLASLNDELHIMISDKDGNTSEIEFDSRTTPATIREIPLYSDDEPWSSTHRPAVATNFLLYNTTINVDGTVYSTKDIAAGHLPGIENHITAHGCGLERYNEVVKALNQLRITGSTADLEWMKTLMGTTLKYSNTYTNPTSPVDIRWWTECVGKYKDPDFEITVNDPISTCIPVFDRMLELWNNKGDRSLGREVWESSHTSIYNVIDKSLCVRAKESGEWIEFKFPETYTKSEIDKLIENAGKVKDVVDEAGNTLVDDDGIAHIVEGTNLWKKDGDTVELTEPSNVTIDSGVSGVVNINGAEVNINGHEVISTMDLEHVLGESETKAMSQKGIFDTIGGYLDDIQVYDVEGVKKDGSIIEAINTLYALITAISESI